MLGLKNTENNFLDKSKSQALYNFSIRHIVWRYICTCLSYIFANLKKISWFCSHLLAFFSCDRIVFKIARISHCSHRITCDRMRSHRIFHLWRIPRKKIWSIPEKKNVAKKNVAQLRFFSADFGRKNGRKHVIFSNFCCFQ